MKYLKFYVDTESVKSWILDKQNVEDIRFTSVEISSDGKEVEMTCVVESKDNSIGEYDSKDCYKFKMMR